MDSSSGNRFDWDKLCGTGKRRRWDIISAMFISVDLK